MKGIQCKPPQASCMLTASFPCGLRTRLACKQKHHLLQFKLFMDAAHDSHLHVCGGENRSVKGYREGEGMQERGLEWRGQRKGQKERGEGRRNIDVERRREERRGRKRRGQKKGADG